MRSAPKFLESKAASAPIVQEQLRRVLSSIQVTRMVAGGADDRKRLIAFPARCSESPKLLATGPGAGG